ncbi:MAG: hypothetical protein PVI21_04710 [Candidatus Woesebacteria bacterium]|jgi:hypothetical protein
MAKIKLPQLFNQKLTFEPVLNEDDELIKDISNDPVTHDNVWQLKEEINADDLDKFWDQTLTEMRSEETK